LIFIGDMADSFSRDISFEYLRKEVIAAVSSHSGQRHQWQWLTKRPQRMAEFSRWLSEAGTNWPPNLWAGTSVTTQATASRIEALSQVGNSTSLHFVSVEPQWESIDLTDFLPSLGWVIQGGHSGSHDHPFEIEWADELRQQCRDQGVAYFLKQLGSAVREGGKKVRFGSGKQGHWEEWPKRLRVRQMPITAGKVHKMSSNG
jgi:protein gp37